MTSQPSTKAVRTTAWTISIFYMLIVFEFFYMASPFALYFYGAYLPGLEFLNRIPQLSWLTSFFLPHFAGTSSALVNSAMILGVVLTAIGVIGFLVGAIQVYSRKLRKRGPAVGGVYKYLRHPQYASLILASVGMLLIWPRFLMVAFFITMLFAYHGLAWVEERECIRKYGPVYIDYQQQTPRFLPFHFPFAGIWEALPKAWPVRVAAGLLTYIAALALAFLIASAVQLYTLGNLFTYQANNAVYVSLLPIDHGTFQRLSNKARADQSVLARLEAVPGERTRFINYVMPWEWSVAEIPMNGAFGHNTPDGYDRRRFKIAYTRALLRTDFNVQGLDILRYTIRNEPVGEAWIDENGQVARVLGPPTKLFFGTVPVPIF
jgi:protein-S-isoprenylcysteine O-methyltransferase Ste14